MSRSITSQSITSRSITSQSAECVRFCVKRNLFTKDVKPTHIFMDGIRGGSVHVPPELESDFLDAFSRDLVNKVTVCLVEKCTPEFHFFVDIDFRGPKELDRMQLGQLIQRQVQKYYPEESSVKKVVVCATEPDKDKTGIHYIFPYLVVDKRRALHIHASIVQALKTEMIEWESEGHIWEEMADNSVYLRDDGDLRMIGSHKTKMCDECRGSRDLICTKCKGVGKLDLGRIYSVIMYIDPDGSMSTRSLGNMNEKVKMSSLRSHRPLTEGFTLFDGCPTPASSPDRTTPHGHFVRLGDDQLKQEVQEFIRASSATVYPPRPKIYTLIEVFRINRNEERGDYYVDVKGPGSDFCLAKEGVHNQSTVRFHITRNGLSQRCFSQKTERCVYFDLPKRIPLPHPLLIKMFPDMRQMDLTKLFAATTEDDD